MENEQNIGITLTANSTSAEKAFERVARATEAVIDQLKDMQKTTEKSADDTERIGSAFGDAEKSVGKFIGTVSGVGVATGLVAKLADELERIKKIQEGQRQSALTVGEAVAAARLNFQGDRTVGEADLEGRLKDIAKERGVSVQSVAGAASDTFSAGAKDNATALRAVSAAFALSRDEATAKELSGRATDIAKFVDTSPEAALGWLSNIGGSSRVSDIKKTGATFLPTLASLTQQGDSPRDAATVYGVFSQLLADTQGDQSKTASIQFAERLGSFKPKLVTKDDGKAIRLSKEEKAAYESLGNTEARMKAMQDNPRLRQAFLAENSFGTESSAFVKGLLSGNDKMMEVYRQTKAATPALDETQAASFRERVGKIKAGQFNPIVDAEKGSAANIEEFKLTSKEGQRAAAARKILEDTLEQAPLDFWDRKGISIANTVKTAAGRDPVKAAEEALNQMAVKARSGTSEEGGLLTTKEDKQFQQLVKDQLVELRKLNENLKANNKATEENTKAVPRQEVRTNSVPSAGRSRSN